MLINRRVDVFLDTESVFAEKEGIIKNFDLDLDEILTEIYDDNIEGKKYAVIFYPVFPNNSSATAKHKLYRDNLKKHLEERDFIVLTVKNGMPRPKMRKEDMSVTKKKLIEKMEERLEKQNDILIISREEEYFNIAKKYTQPEKEVKVLSSEEILHISN